MEENESYSFGTLQRNYFSTYYLWSAIYFRDELEKIENSHSGKSRFDVKHRAFVLNSVINAVTFSEAFINEILKDIIESEINKSDKNKHLIISENSLNHLKNEWESIEKSPSTDKFQTALFIFDKPTFNAGKQPYQNYKLLIDLRNFLIHYKPEIIQLEDKHKLTKKLKDRFKENKLAIGSGNPYFPDHALGFGCAAWAVKSAQNMCDEFCKQVNYVPNYQEVKW